MDFHCNLPIVNSTFKGTTAFVEEWLQLMKMRIKANTASEAKNELRLQFSLLLI